MMLDSACFHTDLLETVLQVQVAIFLNENQDLKMQTVGTSAKCSAKHWRAVILNLIMQYIALKEIRKS